MITVDVAGRILGGARRVSLDLGLSVSEIKVSEVSADLLGHNVKIDDLREISTKENGVFFPEGDSIYQVAISSGRFYKLVPTAGAPTLEIDGIRMHRTKDTTPDSGY